MPVMPPNGVPDLGARQQIAIIKSHLLHLATFEIIDGGLINEACRKHARIIDVPQGIAYYVPLSNQQLDIVRESIT